LENAFDCNMCGQCCQGKGGIVATLEEQEAMAGFLDLDLSAFQDLYILQSGGKFFVQTNEDEMCLFFVRDKGCLVHPVKPRTCRAWPFFRGNLMDESSFEMAREYCPGISKKVSFAEFVRQGLEYLEQHNLSQDQKPSPANALDIKGIK
jgi:uncharacterized protein